MENNAYQMKNMEDIKQNQHDPNEILICDDYVDCFCLYDKKLNETARTIIDLNDC